MAKIILNTNLVNSTFGVEFKSIDVDLNKEVSIPSTDLLITPNDNYVIDAKDFSYGLLPNIVNRIVFQNTERVISSSNRIKAIIFFNPIKITQRNNVIFLPISGISAIYNNEYKLIENSLLDNNVSIKRRNFFNVGIGSENEPYNTITHTISGSNNTVVPVFSKTLTASEGFYFADDPSYKISGLGISGYSMRSSVIKNSSKQIISKSFNLYYTFPQVQFKTRSDDHITFNYNLVEIKNVTEQTTTETEIVPKIYGLDTGKVVGPSGGEKRIRVTGIPGSTFKLIVQNNSKQVYNFETGQFETGALHLVGEIPPAKTNIGFGEYKNIIEIPASTSGEEVKITLIKDDEVDHAKLAQQFDSTTQVSVDEAIVPTTTTEIITQESTINISLKDGGESGFVILRNLLVTDEIDDAADITEFLGVEYVKNGTYNIGAGEYGSSIDTYLDANPFETATGESKSITFLITTDSDSKFIRINRNSRFTQDDDYKRWDSAFESEDCKNYNSEGEVIPTDWGTSIRHSVTSDTSDGTTLDFLSSALDIETSAEIVGEHIDHGVDISDCGEGGDVATNYMAVTISLNGTFGTGNINLELNLKNFLSTYTL